MPKNLDIPTPPSDKEGQSKSQPSRVSDNTHRPESSDLVALNFKVSPEFKHEFRVWAATHGRTQKEVLEKAFELLKRQHS